MKRTAMIAAIGILLAAVFSGVGNVSAQSAFRSDFDHLSTGFPLDGSHRNADCQRCHVGGIFRGTPRECSACHERGGLVRATAMPTNHILSSNLCEDCHLETTWAPVRRVDHSQVIGSCSSCHNGSVADGKPLDHPVTTAPCEFCHSSNAWLPARFDHVNVTGNCISCHNGTDATGKNLTHINTTNICEDCHRTMAWEPVIRVDHLHVIGACSSCHDGAVALGKPLDHVQSGDNCDVCHTTNAWVPAVFDHASVMPGTCSSCHDGTTATGKNLTHIQTLAQCDDCHTTTAWSPANFDHAAVTGSCDSCHNGTTATGEDQGHFVTTGRDCNYCHSSNAWVPTLFMHASPGYSGDHNVQLACTDCHGGNTEIVTWPFAAYQPDCAGCHAGDFQSGPHKKYENPDTSYLVSELSDCTGACHVYTDATMTRIQRSRSGEHRTRSSGW